MAGADGVFVCGKCGHLTIPDNENLKCMPATNNHVQWAELWGAVKFQRRMQFGW